MPADHEILVENLAVELTRGGPDDDKTMTVIIAFTVAAETWRVTLPAVPHAEIVELIRQIQYKTSLEGPVADLVVIENFTTRLDRNPVADS